MERNAFEMRNSSWKQSVKRNNPSDSRIFAENKDLETIEDRILDLQRHKAALVEALLSEETTKLKIDAETLSQLLAPLE